MPTIMVPMHFLGGEELAKICSKCFRRTQAELHTRLLLQYNRAIAAIVIINGDAPAQTMKAYKLGTNALPGWRRAGKNLF